MDSPAVTVVRKATEEDRFGLLKLSAAMHGETDFSCLEFDPRKCIENLGNWIHHPDGLMLVAHDGAEVVGMLAATAKQPWFSNQWVASEDLFYVRPDRRGGRLAFRLLAGYLEWVDSRGIHYGRAGISTGEPGKNAGRLYEHFGMRATGACYSFTR